MRLFLRMATLVTVGSAAAALIALSLSTVRVGAADGDRALHDRLSVGGGWERAVMPLDHLPCHGVGVRLPEESATYARLRTIAAGRGGGRCR